MKINRLQLINFKRFTDLTLENIPNTSKLILLIGSNGSGKSSVFDSFGFINSILKKDYAINSSLEYFKKKSEKELIINILFENELSTTFNESEVKTQAAFRKYNGKLDENTFYGRTSFRQIPRLTRTALGQGGNFDLEKDTDRPKFFIDRDFRFENDIEKITETILKEVFQQNNSSQEIIANYIEPINQAFGNIFGSQEKNKLKLVQIIPPLEGKIAQILFQKGETEFHYNYLSAGEKEIFNLLINLLSRKALFADSIIFIDEIDLHLNTQLQYNLIKEITENWIPEKSQLWTASHSLGFIEYAKNSEIASIFDLDDLNFDENYVISPSRKEDSSIYEISITSEILPSLFKDKKIIFVENKDVKFYANLNLEDVLFIKENNRDGVYFKVINSKYFGLVDRDFLTDSDIDLIKIDFPKLKILGYYCIENYLFHPENLKEYYLNVHKKFDINLYKSKIETEKNILVEKLIIDIQSNRSSYKFYSQPDYIGNFKQKRFKIGSENNEQSLIIAENLKSSDFEIYYKSFSMKEHCKELIERQNLDKIELSKTDWFKNSLISILKN